MPSVSLKNIRSVRRALGKTQSGMAALLGISLRALQSYEQRWRPVPPHVQRLAGFLLALKWCKAGGKSKPCHEIHRCPDAVRDQCPAYQFKADVLCSLVTNNLCHGKTLKSWSAKLTRCQRCPVMKQWLTG
jgi:hypothetical protein